MFAPPTFGKERNVPLSPTLALRLSAHLKVFPAAAVMLPWLISNPALVPLSRAYGLAMKRSTRSRVPVTSATYRTGNEPGHGCHRLL